MAQYRGREQECDKQKINQRVARKDEQGGSGPDAVGSICSGSVGDRRWLDRRRPFIF